MEEIEMIEEKKKNGVDFKDLLAAAKRLEQAYEVIEEQQDPNAKHFAYNIATIYDIIATHTEGGERYRKEQLGYLEKALSCYQPAEMMYKKIIGEIDVIKAKN